MWKLQAGKERQAWGSTSPTQQDLWTKGLAWHYIHWSWEDRGGVKKGECSDFLATSEKEEFLNLWVGRSPEKGEHHPPLSEPPSLHTSKSCMDK